MEKIFFFFSPPLSYVGGPPPPPPWASERKSEASEERQTRVTGARVALLGTGNAKKITPVMQAKEIYFRRSVLTFDG